jgi:hypothetical protein
VSGIYSDIDAEKALGCFIHVHCFACDVFNRLSRHCNAPWIPSPDPEAICLIKEIVLDEESDTPSITDTSLTLNSTLKPCGIVGPTANRWKDLSAQSSKARPDLPPGVPSL